MSSSFGKVAFGVRTGSGPTPAFFHCWTRFLCEGGSRPGDVVLAPVSGLAHHIAAQGVALQFLKTNCDSVLYLDDDMTFTTEEINLLRDDPEHKKYDIINGVCIMGGHPFNPVIKQRSKDDQGREGWINPTDIDEDIVLDVDAVGLAFTLIRRHVFDLIKTELADDAYYFQWGANGTGEDIFFSSMAKGLGLKVGVTTKVRPGHMVEFEATYKKGKSVFDAKIKGVQAMSVNKETIKERG